MPVTADPLYALLYSPPGAALMSWNGVAGQAGQPMVLTYAIVTTPQADGMQPVPASAHAGIRLAFQKWAEVSGLSFVELADDGADGGAMIRVRTDPTVPATAAAWATFASGGGFTAHIGLRPDYADDEVSPGSFMFMVMLHEIGHTLGLKHPFEGNWTLARELDTWNQTVMSYTWPGPTVQQPGPLDIAAIQYLYGTEAREQSDGIAWSFDAAARRFAFSGSGGADALLGTFLGDRIEGGDGDDRLYGLRGDDTLIGGAGADRFWGGDGDDIILAGADGDTLEDAGQGYDWLDYSLAGRPIHYTGGSVVSAAGTDTLLNRHALEAVRGSAHDDTFSLSGSTLRQVDGGQGHDTVAFTFSRAWTSHTLLTTRYQGDVWLHGASQGSPLRLTGIETLAFTDTSVGTASLKPFEPLLYIASYADLRAALRVDAEAGFRHWLHHGGPEGRGMDLFKPFAYLAGYADLMAAFGADGAAGAAHFILHGAAEGRAPRFEGWQYLASHQDVRLALGADPEAAAQHYILHGRAEGRAVTFDGLRYIASHDDLIRALGADAEAGGAHYTQAGAREGRSISFDPYQYIASHADLISALGADPQAGEQHFIRHGFGEHRARDSFDAEAYLGHYADLQAAFGTRQDLAALHYIQHGHAEGRTDLWA